jgi:hypothetical protein
MQAEKARAKASAIRLALRIRLHHERAEVLAAYNKEVQPA